MAKAGAAVEDGTACVRLWLHEVLRVFSDRLVDDADRLWLGRALVRLAGVHFEEQLQQHLFGAGADGSGLAALNDDELLARLGGLMYADFGQRPACEL